MITRINNFLLYNYPKLWKSNIFWNFLSTLLISIILILFADNFDVELSEDKYESGDNLFFAEIPTFIWSIVIIYWLYIQYKNKLPLKNFSYLEVQQLNFLNLLSVLITVTPVLILINLGIDDKDGGYSDFSRFIKLINLIIVIQLIPCVFSALIIRFFTLIEIILTIILGFLVSLITLIIWEPSVSDESLIFNMFCLISYLSLYIYVIIKFNQGTYNKLDKRLSLFLIFFTPWFLGQFPEDFFTDDNYSYPSGFYLGTILFLLSIISWVITKSIQKPVTIK